MLVNDVRVPIHRIKEKQYLFGTKKISAQIINKKLMIRVGGGFMSISEFCQLNADKEVEKLKTLMARDKKKIEGVIADMLTKYKSARFQ